MFRTSNPLLKEKAFDRKAYLTGADPKSMMTVEGTINRALVLLALLILSSLAAAVMATRNPATILPMILVGIMIGLPLAFIVSFKPNLAPILAPIYAVVEGIIVGPISMLYEAGAISSRPGAYSSSGRGQMLQQTLQSGIVLQAIGLTIAVFGLILVLYRARILRATPTFTKVVVLMTGGIFIFYMVNLVLVLGFNTRAFPFLHEGTPIGILFSLFVVGLAAMNFVLDFDVIERGANEGAPKFMEWYAAFGLLVTIIWLYLEILRLLNKLRR